MRPVSSLQVRFPVPRRPRLRRYLPERTLKPFPDFFLNGRRVGFEETFALLPLPVAGASRRSGAPS
jgi:hypothetical protein